MKKNTSRYLFALISYLLISFFFSRIVLLDRGLPGMRDDWYIVPFATQHQFSTTRFMYSWFNGNVLYRSLGEIPGIIMGVLSIIFNFNGEFYAKFFLLFLPALAGYLFFRMSQRLGLGSLASFVSGFVYITSPFFFNSIVSGYTLFLIVLSIIPLVIHRFVDILESKKYNFKSALELAVYIRIAITQDNALYIVAIILSTYFLYHSLVISNKKLFSQNFKRAFSVAILVCIFILPFLSIIPLNFSESIGFVTSGLDVWITNLFPEIIPAIFQDGGGYQYFLRSVPKNVYSPWAFSATMFFAIAILSLTFSKRNKYIPFFSILIAIGVLGFKGTNPPFGQINTFFYTHLPIVMGAFRNTQYFTVFSSLGTAFCFAASLEYITKNRQNSYLYFLLMILTVVIKPLPFYTGNYADNLQNVELSNDLKEMDQALRNQPDHKTVLWLPPIVPITYKDSRFAGLDPMVHSLPQAFIGIAGNSPFQRQLIESLYILDNQDLFRWFLSIYNTGYIAKRDDFESITIAFMSPDYIKYWPVWTNQRLKDNLLTMPEVVLNKEFSDKTALYNYQKPFPLIHIPTTLTIIDKDPLKPAEFGNLVPSVDHFSLSLFSTQQWNQPNLPLLADLDLSHPPKILYHKVDPTKYTIKIERADQPFIIVFLDNYHDFWKLYLKDSTRPISDSQKNHFIANGYANAWYLDPNTICDNFHCERDSSNDSYSFELDLEFYPQKIYLPMAIIGYGSFFISVTFLMLNYLRSKHA